MIFEDTSISTVLSYFATFLIFRDLQDRRTFAPLQIQNLQIFSKFSSKIVIFRDFCKFLMKFAQICFFSPKFSRNFAGIAGNWRRIFFLFLGEKGKQKKDEGYGEKGIRNRMPGKGKWQSSKSELAAQEERIAYVLEMWRHVSFR